MLASGLPWERGVRDAAVPTTPDSPLICSFVEPVLAQDSAGPFYSLFRNVVGERLAPAGVMFPEEAYDYGVREAVEAIAAVARPGAVIVSDAPGAVTYYLERHSRKDLRVRSLSAEGLPPGDQPRFVIVQDQHLTFESRGAIAHLRRASTPWRTFHAGEALTAQVFQIPRS